MAALAHERDDGVERNPWARKTNAALIPACQGLFYAGGVVGFSPRATPQRHRSLFLAGTCWGTFDQRRARGKQTDLISIRAGELRIEALRLTLPQPGLKPRLTARAGGRSPRPVLSVDGASATLAFPRACVLSAGEHLRVEFTW